MGAWGAGSFENDTALDWVWALEESSDLRLVEEAIWDVLHCGDDLDADVGSVGLAAAEVTAALRGKPVAGLPEEVAEWVGNYRNDPGDTLVADCLAAVDRIRNDDASELKELWEEDDELAPAWHSVLDDLATRLQ
ncbi:MAG: DUF4259 domain-containing protein [Anaerolineae bacterium]|jgi:predicted trehalose synthase